MKYKIAILTGQLVIGGAERQLYFWISNADRRKFKMIVLTLNPDKNDYWENKIKELGVEIINVPHRNNHIKRLVFIIRKLRSYRPDLIHGWHLFTVTYAGLAAKYFGIYSLGGVRGSYPTFLSSTFQAFLAQVLPDGLVANSRTTAKQIESAKIFKKLRVFPVQNAIANDIFDRSKSRKYISRKWGLSTNCIWIGTLGRMDPKKHFDVIVRVVANLIKAGEHIHLIIFGKGMEGNNLEKLANQLKISDYVTFTGEIPDARSLLSGLDIFCFTSTDEGLPNAVMEAGAAGVPIVAWKLPFMEEILRDRESALLVDYNDIEQLTRVVRKLIKSKHERKMIGRNGEMQILRRFSVENYVKGMTHVYEDMLSKKQGR